MIEPFDDLEPGHYRAILCDPPWSFATWSLKGHGKSASQHYDTMDLDAIRALPVRDLAFPGGCALTMWTTAPMLPVAIEVMRSWRFTFKSAGAWAKQSTTGRKWAFGTGYCYRSAAEFWLLGTIGKPERTSHAVRNLIVAPIREHSRKPDQMRQDIEALWPGPYLELFARERATNWEAWGHERDKYGTGVEAAA